MQKKNLQQLIIILPIVWIAGTFVYFKYLLLPINEKIKTKKAELESIKKDYVDACNKSSRLENLKQEIQILKQEIDEMKKMLPEEEKKPDLIRVLKREMEHHNIIWEKISPSLPSPKDYYIEHSYTIPFKASYHDLAMFLTKIGQMERIFSTKFSKLMFTTDPKDNRITISGELTFTYYTGKG